MLRARRQPAALLAGALCLTAVLAAPGSVPAARAGSASALVTQDAVIPPDPAPAAIGDRLLMAGSTGFLHQYNSAGQYLWTDYATGHTVIVSALAGLSLGQFTPAGGDSVAVVGTTASTANAVSELDLAHMTWQHWTLPAGDMARGVFGNSVLAAVPVGTVLTWQVMTFAQDGTDTVAPVSGLPAGTTLTYAQPRIGDASAAVVSYGVASAPQYGLLDLATANVTAIPDPDTSHQSIVLSSDRVALYDPVTEASRVYSRAGLLDGTDTAAQTVALAAPASGTYQIGLAGDHVIAVPPTGACTNCGSYPVKPALDVPLSGAVPGQALPEAQLAAGAIAQAPGGAVLAIGGSGPADWSVRRLTVDSNDNLTGTVALSLTGPLSNGGLTISQGLVRHIEVQPVPGGTPTYQLFNHLLAPDTTAYLPDPKTGGSTLGNVLPCTPGGSCVRTVDGNWYGTSYLQAGSATSMVLREKIDGYSSSMSMSLPSAGGTIADASLSYVVVDGASPAHQYVVDVGHDQILSTGPVSGAALWFGTLWRSDGAGHLQATNLDTHTTATPIATGANCTASVIQATGRWIYWSCGPQGPAGVYDLRQRLDIPVPAGPMLLGDGYLVQHDSATGDLTLYDVHTDSVTGPVTLASVPAGPAADDRGITWAVDKYSGDVAYVGADDSVQVINTGVPAGPPAIAYPPAQWLPQEISFDTNGAWYQGLALSRPVTSWTLTIRRAGTSQVVRTQTGGAARAGVFASWNGYLASGAKAYSGPYTWSLSVTTSDSSTPSAVPGSTLRVECGQIPFRSYDCGGAPALLADTGGYQGASFWYNGTDNGLLSDNGYTDNWPLCSSSWCVSAIVPFGDFNGDGFADILVRYRSGLLRAYLGFGQSYFNTQQVKSIKLGTGWNRYNALTSPGDLTRDGKPDLLGRDTEGRLWLIPGTGKGTFGARVEIGSGWGGYDKLVGAGDLTGDGIGDLLAIDKSGVMWRYDGNGHGGFAARRLVGSGWSRYNAVIGIGGLSVDGCNDLVLRDRQGVLWRYDGNCRGGFVKLTKIGQGWGKFPALF